MTNLLVISIIKKNASTEKAVLNSDYLSISMEQDLKEVKGSYKRLIWDYKNADFDTFQQSLSEYDWSNCFVDDDIDRTVNLAKTHIPNKMVEIRTNDKPFYNNFLCYMRHKRDRAFKNHKKKSA